MRHVVRESVLIAIVAALAPWPAAAQVYPDSVAVKAHAIATVYQRRTRDDNREAQTERTTKTFKLGSDGSLDLSTVSGDITITRGGGNDATVEIVKTAHGRDSAEAKEMLGLVTVDVMERAGRVELKTRYPNGSGRRSVNVSVDYIVTAPAGTRVSASSISGNVKISDIKGDITASTISGDLRISGAGRIDTAHSISGTIEINEAKTDGGIDASTISGDVRLHHITARRLNGGTVSGDVHLEDVAADTIGAHTMNGEIIFSGTLARRGRYEFKTHSGDVRLTLAGGTGFEVDANTFSGDIRSDLPITTHGTTDASGRRGPHRSQMQGTFGDGSAVLNISTFSGSIVIGKK
jgi:DUF4097 and DUF4098 domain-containing protein YvlB